MSWSEKGNMFWLYTLMLIIQKIYPKDLDWFLHIYKCLGNLQKPKKIVSVWIKMQIETRYFYLFRLLHYTPAILESSVCLIKYVVGISMNALSDMTDKCYSWPDGLSYSKNSSFYSKRHHSLEKRSLSSIKCSSKML